MGFWDKAGELAGKAVNVMNEKMERIDGYKAQYDRLDDKQLIARYKSSSGDQKLACCMLLKERGYGGNGN